MREETLIKFAFVSIKKSLTFQKLLILLTSKHFTHTDATATRLLYRRLTSENAPV